MQRLGRLSIGPASALAALLGGIIALYIPGVIGLSVMIDKPLLASLALVAPFLPGDVIKVILCAVITRAIYSARPQMVLAKSPQPAPEATAQAAENPPQKDETR
jgi:biotin transport system substrate-specific component